MTRAEKLIQHHERAIQILEAVEYFEKREMEMKKDLMGWLMSFHMHSPMHKRVEHNCEICEMAKNRMDALYKKHMGYFT